MYDGARGGCSALAVLMTRKGGDPIDESRPATADPLLRLVGALIDLVVSAVLGLVPVVGLLAAVLYWLLRDGLDLPFMDRRSIGKKVIGIRPVRMDGSSIDPATSIRRNWVFCIGVFLWPLLFVPVLGWALIILLIGPVVLAQMVLLLVELVLVTTSDDGRRWGDRLAGTMVIREIA
jgi:uncharacterized RDD family membrane protein YckC